MKVILSPITKTAKKHSVVERFSRRMALDARFQYELNTFLDRTQHLANEEFDKAWDSFLARLQGRVAQR